MQHYLWRAVVPIRSVSHEVMERAASGYAHAALPIHSGMALVGGVDLA
jgi:hypothetical protein